MEKEKLGKLGKGLASLLPPSAVPPQGASVSEELSNKDRHPGISMCLLEDIVPNEFQPRKTFDDQTIEELSQSIKNNGLIQPLIVRKKEKGYQLVAGERRWRAAKLAGLKQVPIVIRKTTDKEALELAIIENVQREDLNCIDTATAYFQLVHDFDLKQEEVSEKVGKDRASIANYLRLLKLPDSVQLMLRDQVLSFGHGKALLGLGLDDLPLVERFAQDAIDKRWSVRELENQIQRLKEEKAPSAQEEISDDPVVSRLKTISRDLSTKLSTKVRVKGDAQKGKIVIEYFTPDDLERVLNTVLR
ncbi:MAG: ParB/RepB/Spo0J family partition protein [Bacteriovoracia bacterium]